MIKGLLIIYLQNEVLPAAIYPFHNSHCLGRCISAVSLLGRMIEAVHQPPDAPSVATALVRLYVAVVASRRTVA